MANTNKKIEPVSQAEAIDKLVHKFLALGPHAPIGSPQYKEAHAGVIKAASETDVSSIESLTATIASMKETLSMIRETVQLRQGVENARQANTKTNKIMRNLVRQHSGNLENIYEHVQRDLTKALVREIIRATKITDPQSTAALKAAIEDHGDESHTTARSVLDIIRVGSGVVLQRQDGSQVAIHPPETPEAQGPAQGNTFVQKPRISVEEAARRKEQSRVAKSTHRAAQIVKTESANETPTTRPAVLPERDIAKELQDIRGEYELAPIYIEDATNTLREAFERAVQARTELSTLMKKIPRSQRIDIDHSTHEITREMLSNLPDTPQCLETDGDIKTQYTALSKSMTAFRSAVRDYEEQAKREDSYAVEMWATYGRIESAQEQTATTAAAPA